MMLSAQLAALALLGVLMLKRGAQPPIFALYVAYSLSAVAAQLIVSSDRLLYFKIYWIGEAGEVSLAIASVYEAFLRTFRGYFLLIWFRCLLPAIVLAITGYAIWKAVARPPVLNGPLAAIIVGAEVGAQYLILATFLCHAVLHKILRISHRRFEYAITAGFGISSLGTLLATMIRSEFGTRFMWVITWGSSALYLLALIIWIGSCLTPAASEVSGANGITAPDALEHLEQYRTALKKVERARWR